MERGRAAIKRKTTDKESGAPLIAPPGGEWVYYRDGLTSKLRRISMKGGAEHQVLDKVKGRAAFSPDGAEVAFSKKQGDKKTSCRAIARGRADRQEHSTCRPAAVSLERGLDAG
jgi:hypothetical protein